MVFDLTESGYSLEQKEDLPCLLSSQRFHQKRSGIEQQLLWLPPLPVLLSSCLLLVSSLPTLHTPLRNRPEKHKENLQNLDRKFYMRKNKSGPSYLVNTSLISVV